MISIDRHFGLPGLRPPDGRIGAGPTRNDRLSRMRRWAIAAAALFHLGLVLWLWLIGRAAMLFVPLPEPIPVRIVYEQPKPPPALPLEPPPPAPKPSPLRQAPVEPAKQPLAYRESGKDLETKAPRPADQAGPQEQAPADKATAPETQARDKPAPAPQPEAPKAPTKAGLEKPKPAVARPEPHQSARETRAPQVAPPRPPGIEEGDKAKRGDPYLNAVKARIAREMYYPPQAAPLGLRGSVQYDVIVGRMGEILSVAIVKSSGASMLDDAAVQILRRAGPFPPLPNSWPSPAHLSGNMPMYPVGQPHG